MSGGRRRTPAELRSQRNHRGHQCWGHLIVAPLWVSYQANLGTLLRTCDAVGACMAVPRTPHYKEALARGDTLHRRPHMHWAKGGAIAWLERERQQGARIVAVELADDAIPLPLLEPARVRTVVVLGHEHHGVPDEAWELIDDVVQIPMIGRGSSLNVAVAGSLVLYRLAAMA